MGSEWCETTLDQLGRIVTGKTPPSSGFPRGLGLDTITGFTMLMQDNKLRAVFRPKAAGEGGATG